MTEYGVAAHARLRPEKVAIVHGDRRITFGELDDLATRAATVLLGRGVGPTGRLGIALGNRPEWIIAALGAARLGAQVVPIPGGATRDEREYFCTDGEVASLVDEVTLDEFLRALATADVSIETEWASDYVTLRAYTSGTTGRPKAVLRPVVPAAQSIEGMVAYYTNYGIDAVEEVNITASPLHHIAGFSGLHSASLLGHTAVLLDHFDATEWLRAVEWERVTYSWCAPVHLFRLMAVPDAERAAADVSSIKRVLHGSAPCAPSLKRAVIDFLPDGALWETYGGTETMGTVITPEEWLRKPGSVGKAAPGSTIKIYEADADGADAHGTDGGELPVGEIGLIYIGSDWGLGFRYEGPDELTEAVYRGNLATLGDMGYLDEDGYLFLADRHKDMIITGGSNVYPAEVESILVTLDGIAEAAVIGLPDDEYGEIVTGVVVRNAFGPPVTADEVIAFAREHLVRYKAPRRVEFLPELPRDPMGKILKRELRARFS